MTLRMPWFILAVAFMLAWTLAQSGHAFNLVEDIAQQTQWTFGSAIEAGTSIALRSDDSTGVRGGQFLGSALASVANYRFLNFAGGGTFIPRADGSLRALDTGKIGLNLAYLFKNFVNQPPPILNNLVIGPSLSTSLVTTPHVFIPEVNLNYSFAGTGK